MNIKITRIQGFIILVLFNIVLVSGIIFLKSEINKNPVGLSAEESSKVLPILTKAQVNVDSKAFIAYDTDARVVVAGKNENLRFAPASAAKIMTAIVSLEAYAIDDTLKAVGVSSVVGSKMGLFEDEEMTVLNLLYGLMLPSGNDAAYVLASNYTGGFSAFVARMNEKAKELNMQNTKFFDPAGYDDNNYTTAIDMARLGAFAIKNPNLAKIVATRYISVTDVTGQNVHELTNLNEMLGKNGVNGIKTGFTDEAGGVLVTSINHENRYYIVVVLKSPDRFADTKSVIDEAISKIRLIFY